MSETPHRFRVRVRYEETDRMGVVYHSNHFKFFEIGRTELMRERGIRYRDLEESGTMLAVTEARARFRGRVTYDDEIEIETVLSMRGKAVFRFDYRILRAQDGAVVCDGHTEHVCINARGRPIRPPAFLVKNVNAREEGSL
jgi:acyl-CoA thioester hydrolase